MKKRLIIGVIAMVCVADLMVNSAGATPFFFSTGNPDGLIGTASRPASAGKLETETADDFVLTQQTTLNSATFTGLLPAGAPLSSVSRVEIELYHVFPTDSTNPPSGHVPMRTNSPSDVEIGSATRDSVGGSLSFITTFLNTSFTVNNSVVNGIHPSPGQMTGGEGPATGEEVLFSVAFNPGIVLAADHYFFRPEVQLTSGDFLWLSAPKPIVSPGTAFPAGTTDLQSWTRNSALAPDWLRIGTDIVGGATPPTYNAAFTLSGELVPEPSSIISLCIGLAVMGCACFGQWMRHMKIAAY
jgi:hypothetical protein